MRLKSSIFNFFILFLIFLLFDFKFFIKYKLIHSSIKLFKFIFFLIIII